MPEPSDELVEAIREYWEQKRDDGGWTTNQKWHPKLSIMLTAYDEQRARAECAEAECAEIADSYATVLLHITNGALSLPGTDPQAAIAMSDDLDTERWNEETAALEARAAQLERDNERLQFENDWAVQFTCPKCGPCGNATVTTKKTCLVCGAGLIRSKHPRMAWLERGNDRLQDIIEYIRTYDPQVVDAAEAKYEA